MPYLVDGHNLLWAIHHHDEHFAPVDDRALCRLLARYGRSMHDTVELIFDGIGPPDKGAFYGHRNLQVHFAGEGTDADTVIEHKVQACTQPRRLMVVSTDRRVRAAARRVKARSIASVDFWITVLERLNRKRPAREPVGKRHGVSEQETQQWLKTFGLE